MLVSVLLLDVGGSALELLANLATVDENLPVDDTSRLAVREDVLQAERSALGAIEKTARRTSKVVLPAPEAPMSAVRVPGLTYP